MLATLRVIAPAAELPVDLDMAMRHARVDNDDERDLFALYLGAATEQVEKYLGRTLITKTLRWSISETKRHTPYPYGIVPSSAVPLTYEPILRQLQRGVVELPYAPVQGIVSVSTGEWGDVDTVLVAGTDYHSDLAMDPARVRLDASLSWGSYSHLAVTYTAGYGDGPDSLPRPLAHAVLMLATSLYENRGDDDRGGMSPTVKALLTPYRIYTYAS